VRKAADASKDESDDTATVPADPNGFTPSGIEYDGSAPSGIKCAGGTDPLSSIELCGELPSGTGHAPPSGIDLSRPGAPKINSAASLGMWSVGLPSHWPCHRRFSTRHLFTLKRIGYRPQKIFHINNAVGLPGRARP